jgi:hypothetical protein
MVPDLVGQAGELLRNRSFQSIDPVVKIVGYLVDFAVELVSHFVNLAVEMFHFGLDSLNGGYQLLDVVFVRVQFGVCKLHSDFQIFHCISHPNNGLPVVLKLVGFLGLSGKGIFYFGGLRISHVALSLAPGV